MRKEKYYILINSLGPGGAERAAVNLANKLNKSGYEVYLISLFSVKFYELDKEIIYIPLSSFQHIIGMIICYPYYIWKFKQLLRHHGLNQGISLLQASNFINILTNKQAHISLRTHISLLSYKHKDILQRISGYIQRILIRVLYPRAHKIIVNSVENKYDLADYLKISENKVNVMLNVVDTQLIENIKYDTIEEKINKFNEKTKIFVTVGKLEKHKGYHKIIDALGYVSNHIDKNWIYLILGGGSEMQSLQAQAANYGMENNVMFLGVKKNVFKYLALADYFLYGSEVESMSNALLEAKAMNLPVITSDFKTGAKEIVLGYYEKNMKINYPMQGSYGILLDPKKYQQDFVYVYKNHIMNINQGSKI